MNKHSIISLLAWCFAAVSLAACSDGEGIDPSSAEPVVAYPYETLVADLNKADNLPVVAIVKSEAGLRSVALAILTDGGETIPVSTVTEFFDRHSFSLSEKINYKSDYVSAVVSAEDLLGRRTEAALPIRIIDIVEPPVIVFSPESWEYDETVGGDIPRTHIEVSSPAMLKSVEITRVKSSDQTVFTSVDFSSEDPQSSWTFDEQIHYDEFDRGMKVKVTDSYGQVRIATMAVNYKTVPPPSVEFAAATIIADRDEEKSVEIAIESQAGVAKVALYRVEGKTETLVSEKTCDGEKTLAYAGKMVFTDATSGVKAVVTDRVGRSTTASAGALVNLIFAESIPVGTAPLADGAEGGVKRLLSLGDQRTYSVQECFDDPSLQTHADVKVYYMNGNAQSVRIYSMKEADNKNGEYAAGDKNINAFSCLNATCFKLVTNLSFDTATAADIAAIDAASIQSTNIKGKEELIGATIAFKTASGSSAGASRVGLLKLVSISEKVGVNANARIFTFAVKFPKE